MIKIFLLLIIVSITSFINYSIHISSFIFHGIYDFRLLNFLFSLILLIFLFFKVKIDKFILYLCIFCPIIANLHDLLLGVFSYNNWWLK